MRNIKFRAWDKISKSMKKVKEIGFEWVEDNGNPWEAILEDNSAPSPDLSVDGNDIDSKCILMQFTGLKDKNGTEIYEGDIVKETSGDISTVYWSKAFGGFHWSMIGNPWTQSDIFHIRYISY